MTLIYRLRKYSVTTQYLQEVWNRRRVVYYAILLIIILGELLGELNYIIVRFLEYDSTPHLRLSWPEDAQRWKPCFDSRKKRNTLSAKPKKRQKQQSRKDWRKRHGGKKRKRHKVEKKNARGNWPIVSRQIVLPPLNNNVIRIRPRLSCLP